MNTGSDSKASACCGSACADGTTGGGCCAVAEAGPRRIIVTMTGTAWSVVRHRAVAQRRSAATAKPHRPARARPSSGNGTHNAPTASATATSNRVIRLTVRNPRVAKARQTRSAPPHSQREWTRRTLIACPRPARCTRIRSRNPASIVPCRSRGRSTAGTPADRPRTVTGRRRSSQPVRAALTSRNPAGRVAMSTPSGRSTCQVRSSTGTSIPALASVTSQAIGVAAAEISERTTSLMNRRSAGRSTSHAPVMTSGTTVVGAPSMTTPRASAATGGMTATDVRP